jgi:hypothetical protein
MFLELWVLENLKFQFLKKFQNNFRNNGYNPFGAFWIYIHFEKK